ncbi:low temperature requirement protein A [Actinomadura madurae]|uniref:low temperature requirement protein A n=1 Tax=Actinomadura madurae TaxID=1993 RepID=UPI00202714BC|nr:low temperature requirement protein A [Actinomadura madurae]MCP9969575.1 low temperature requirement protein A [Actinomadura madurae]URM98307.1 low temperature requirement protein A [Actinomadura madurae]URN08997.1 low temperature requirement protein A [Actinomadura madurae]
MLPLRSRMVARDLGEPHRTSSPLELLFDLTFVAAVSQIAGRLAHATEEAHAGDAIAPFLMVFFAIWWAWMNFTWFASAYDTGDVLYRVLTFVQMAGVLILAAGVPAAFDGDFTTVTFGYLVMRIGLVSLWVRAAVAHPAGRATALRYAAGLSIVQVFWVSRLALPDGGPTWLFFVLAACDLSVPLIAERPGMTTWHPHHIAERYGLFTIILLGESVLAATNAVQDAVEHGVSGELITIALAGLAILFALWWIYFTEPAGEGLEARRDRSFIWGYGHYFVFAALAATGAGLEVAVASAGHHIEAGTRTVAASVALPVAVVLVMLWALHAPMRRPNLRPDLLAATAALVLLTILAAPTLGIPGTLILMAVLLILPLTTTLTREPEPAT